MNQPDQFEINRLSNHLANHSAGQSRSSENAESLADLPLTDAQAAAAKGGEGSNANIQNHPHQLSLR